MRDICYILIKILIISLILFGPYQTKSHHKRSNPVPGSCTIFSISKGDKALFGNNEDFYKPKTYLWTEPATEGNYGCIYVGFKDYSHQGGINEKGLCFDANALPKSSINLHPELQKPPFYAPPYEEFMIWIPVLILRKASTVREAIEIARKYQRKNWYPNSGNITYQLHFADATGDAVVMSVDEYGELVFTRKKQGENYLISTNYNRANPQNALAYPCERYNVTENMLAQIDSENDLSIDFMKSILDTTHQEGIFSTTLYSNIFDLKNGVIYLYHWYQFEEVVVLNVAEELAKGNVHIRIKDLFSQKTVRNASRAYMSSIIFLCVSIIMGIVGMIAIIHYLKKYRLKVKNAN